MSTFMLSRNGMDQEACHDFRKTEQYFRESNVLTRFWCVNLIVCNVCILRETLLL